MIRCGAQWPQKGLNQKSRGKHRGLRVLIKYMRFGKQHITSSGNPPARVSPHENSPPDCSHSPFLRFLKAKATLGAPPQAPQTFEKV